MDLDRLGSRVRRAVRPTLLTVASILSSFLVACDREDETGQPAPVVELPVCGDPAVVLDDADWQLESEPTTIFYWEGDRLHVLPGQGIARRVPAAQVQELARLGTPAVGSAGTMVLTRGGGPALIFDVGSGVSSAVYAYQLRALTAAEGLTQVSGIHLSHAHADHTNHLQRVVETFRVPASNVVIPWFMVPWAGSLNRQWEALANNPETAELGYGELRPGTDVYAGSRTRGFVTARFRDAQFVIGYVASEAAIAELDARLRRGARDGGFVDAASALMVINQIGRVERFAILGDLRGRTILALSEAMGEAGFNRVFRGVEVLHGFNHHLGVVEGPDDVEGLVRLLRATAYRVGRLHVVVQTSERQMRARLVEALNLVGVDVTTVGRGSRSEASSAVADAGGRVTRTGPAVRFHPAPDQSREVLQRVAELAEYDRVFQRHRQELLRQFPEAARRMGPALQAANARALSLFFGGPGQTNSLADLTLWQLIGGRDATRRGTREINDRATFPAEAIRQNRIEILQQQAVDRVLEAEHLGEVVRLLVRYEAVQGEIAREVEDALDRGRTSARLYELIELLEPDVRSRLRRSAPDRAEASAALREAVFRARSGAGASVPVSPRLGARVGAGILAAAELGRIGIELYSLVAEVNDRALRRSLESFLWWVQRGAVPRVRATVDGRLVSSASDLLAALDRPRYTLTDAVIDQVGRAPAGISEEQLAQLGFMKHNVDTEERFLERIAGRLGQAETARLGPTLLAAARRYPAEGIEDLVVQPPEGDNWLGFLLWADQNIEDYDDYRVHFREAPGPAIRHAGSRNFPNGPWEALAWDDGSSTWVRDAQLTVIMRRIGERVVSSTNAKLDEAWSQREPRVREEGPQMRAAPEDVGLNAMSGPEAFERRPTARARFKSGVTPVVYSTFDPSRVLVSGSGWFGDQPHLLLFENGFELPGYVLVSGANYNSYGSIRAATVRQWDPRRTEDIPRPVERSDRHRRILQALRRGFGEFIPSGLEDGSGTVRYPFDGPNRMGIALARVDDLDIERLDPVDAGVTPPPPEPITFTPPPLVICDDFNHGAAEWRVIASDGTDNAPARHRVADESSNGFLLREHVAEDADRRPLDLVLAFDLTSSMSDELDSVRNAARELVAALREASSDLRLGLVSFRDREDDPATVRQLLPLTDDMDERLSDMAGWSTSGGGDEAEDQLHALRGALSDDMAFRHEGRILNRDVARAIVVITDAPAKRGADGSDFEGNTIASITGLARDRGVQVHSIIVGGNGRAMEDASALTRPTGGSVHSLATAGGVVEALLGSAESALRGAPRFWMAPPKYRGDRAAFVGTALVFDAWCEGEGRALGADEVILRSGGRELRLAPVNPVALDGVPGGPWARWTVPLTDEAGWRSGEDVVGESALRGVLGSLDALGIQAERHTGSNRCALDNVFLGLPPP